jgi:EpsI family protein
MSPKHTVTASAIMVITMIFLGYISHTENIHPNKPFSTFPRHIGEWFGTEEYLDREIIAVSGVDDYFLCNYRTSDSPAIQLYIGFYQSQREGDLIHSPKNCMPGAGWNIVQTSLENLEISHPHNAKAIKLILQKSDQNQIMLYWFQCGGRIISSEYMQKIYMIADSVTRHRTDGAFVRLISNVTDNDETRTLNSLKEFIGVLMPILYEYIPS